jgi:hypothetical protein
MKIKEILLFTNELPKQKKFFESVLGFDLLEEASYRFSIQVGWTKLVFQKSRENYKYHYCFLIPSNKLEEAIIWLSKKTNLVKIEKERVIQYFENWNAHAIYFYDGAGNLAEFIVRHNLKNESQKNFDLSQILGVNEIGMPTNDIRKINQEIEKDTGSNFWKGNKEIFGTNRTPEGLFLLVNNEIKKTWFPTEMFTQSSPFEISITVNQKNYFIKFKNQEIVKIKKG